MTDAYWKKRAAELEHHEPAHKTQGKSLEDTLNGVPGLSPPPPSPPLPSTSPPGGHNREIDIGNALAAKIAASMAQQQQQAPRSHQGPPGTSGGHQQVVYIREGVQSFRELQGTQSPVAIAINIGPTAGLVGKEFELKGTKKVYVLENPGQAVDLSNLDYSRVITLVEVKDFWSGSMLVPESAVMRQGSSKPRLLKG